MADHESEGNVPEMIWHEGSTIKYFLWSIEALIQNQHRLNFIIVYTRKLGVLVSEAWHRFHLYFAKYRTVQRNLQECFSLVMHEQ